MECTDFLGLTVAGEIVDYQFNLNTGDFELNIKDEKNVFKVTINIDEMPSVDIVTFEFSQGTKVFVKGIPYYDRGSFLKIRSSLMDIKRIYSDSIVASFSNTGVAVGKVKKIQTGRMNRITIHTKGKDLSFQFMAPDLLFGIDVGDCVIIGYEIYVKSRNNLQYIMQAKFIDILSKGEVV